MRKPRLFEPEVSIPEEIRGAVELWTAYKREQFRFTYKPLALAALVERMAAMGPERALAAIKYSMSGGWEGIYEEKRAAEKAAETTARRSWPSETTQTFVLTCRSCSSVFRGLHADAEGKGWDWGVGWAVCPECITAPPNL